jgi:hypothetical protein
MASEGSPEGLARGTPSVDGWDRCNIVSLCPLRDRHGAAQERVPERGGISPMPRARKRGGLSRDRRVIRRKGHSRVPNADVSEVICWRRGALPVCPCPGWAVRARVEYAEPEHAQVRKFPPNRCAPPNRRSRPGPLKVVDVGQSLCWCADDSRMCTPSRLSQFTLPLCGLLLAA